MARRSLHIAVVTPRYTLSGVALAQHRLAAALADAGHRVDLIIGRCDPDLSVPAIPGVAIRVLGCRRTRSMLLPLWRYLRAVRPDILFSAEDHLNSFVLAAAIGARSATRISCSSRVTPFDTYSSTPFTRRWVLKCLARSVAWRAMRSPACRRIWWPNIGRSSRILAMSASITSSAVPTREREWTIPSKTPGSRPRHFP